MTTDVEREAFEAEYVMTGEGVSDVYDAMWSAFQKGAAWQRAQSAPVVPEGWRLVPVEPSATMLSAAFDATGESEAMRVRVNVRMLKIYRAMLAAAPQSDHFVDPADMVAARQEQGDDTARLDNLERLKEYVVGFAPSGDWSVFSAKDRRTCYGKTLREALDKMMTMHASAEGK